jgi:hypothetical protein
MLAFAAVTVAVIMIVCAFWGRPPDIYGIEQVYPVRARLDGHQYRVHLTHADPSGAADTMAFLHESTIQLLRRLRGEYLRPAARGAFPRRARATRLLLQRYNPDNITENSPRDPDGDTSYTINKGVTLALCLRERDPAGSGRADVHDIHDINTLLFVTFHELVHIAIDEHGHPAAFWETFKFVLEDAAAAGLLLPVDYARTPAKYCGMLIDYNPLFDHGLRAAV